MLAIYGCAHGKENMKRILLIAATCTVLAGCTSFKQLDSGLQGMVGKKISVAIDALGYPASERTVAGLKLIEWSQSSTAVVPTSTSTTGIVQSGTKSSSFSGITLSSEQRTYNCKITMRVDNEGVIQDYDYDGNLGGCMRYINMLKRRTSRSPTTSSAS